jgi:hypothetical protein
MRRTRPTRCGARPSAGNAAERDALSGRRIWFGSLRTVLAADEVPWFSPRREEPSWDPRAPPGGPGPRPRACRPEPSGVRQRVSRAPPRGAPDRPSSRQRASAVNGSDVASTGAAPVSSSSATAMPAAPPRRHRARLSVSSCPIKRPRLAPRAARSAISLRRAAPLASPRFAAFAQAMSKTMRTAPNTR